MADSGGFDPYYMWLGIGAEEQPANYYRLLDVKTFESNSEVLDTGFQRRMAYLRGIKSGDRLEHAERIKNELAEARHCLLNHAKKTTYDVELKRQLKLLAPWTARAPEPPPLPPAWSTPSAPELHEPSDRTFRAAAPSRVRTSEAPTPPPTSTTPPPNPFSFAGRASRGDYWTSIVFAAIVVCVGHLIWSLVPGSWHVLVEFAIGAIYAAIVVLALWMLLAVHVKRWHDINLSGWLNLLGAFVPLMPWLGLILLCLLGFMPGSVGLNKYGAPPPDDSYRTP